jgi:hypothetical protein
MEEVPGWIGFWRGCSALAQGPRGFKENARLCRVSINIAPGGSRSTLQAPAVDPPALMLPRPQLFIPRHRDRDPGGGALTPQAMLCHSN